MKNFEVVTIGSALKDIMFYSDDISVVKGKSVTEQKLMAVEYGAKLPIDDIYINYGGGALNVGIGLDNFGVRVSPMVRVGRDQVGKEIYSSLKSKKIDTSLVSVDPKARTGFSLIMTATADKEHTIFTHKGATVNLELEGLRNFRTKWFAVSALSGKSWTLEMEKLIRQTKRGVKIAWNPGLNQIRQAKRLANFLADLEILLVNKDEAIEIVRSLKPKSSKKDLTTSKFLLKEIHKLGPQKVVITQGAKGVVALDELGRYYMIASKAVKKRIVDTVGAGDSFFSGLMAGMVKWENFEKALTLGIRNSANVLYQVGAQNGLLKIKLK